jgi:hypothetical protein
MSAAKSRATLDGNSIGLRGIGKDMGRLLQDYESIRMLCLASDSVPRLDQVHCDPAV